MKTNSTVYGTIRSTVQTLVVALLTLGPVRNILDAAGLDWTTETITAVVVGLVMAVYWSGLTTIQKSKFAAENPLVGLIVGWLMGGRSAADYNHTDTA